MLTKSGLYYQPVGNSKVDCPVFSVSSGTYCVNAETCPFSVYRDGGKAKGYPKCYAQKTEDRFPYVLGRLTENAYLIWQYRDDVAKSRLMAQELAQELAEAAAKMQTPYVRLNEAGDLSSDNIRFLCFLVQELTARGITAYTYTKSREAYANMIRLCGAVVLRSERDFVLVHSASEAKAKGLPVCAGIGCGNSCTRCCEGLKSAVVAH